MELILGNLLGTGLRQIVLDFKSPPPKKRNDFAKDKTVLIQTSKHLKKFSSSFWPAWGQLWFKENLAVEPLGRLNPLGRLQSTAAVLLPHTAASGGRSFLTLEAPRILGRKEDESHRPGFWATVSCLPVCFAFWVIFGLSFWVFWGMCFCVFLGFFWQI